MDVMAIRRLLDQIKCKYGDTVKITIYSDGSGFILPEDDSSEERIEEFLGLGELSDLLDY